MSRSNVGGIIVALMMQQLNKTRPDDYLLAMRVLWVPIGLMILVRLFDIADLSEIDLTLSSGCGFPSPRGSTHERETSKPP